MQCTLRGALENRFSQYVPLKDESDALAGLVKGLAATSTGDCRDLHPSLRGLLAGVGCLDSTHVVVDCLRLGKCSWGSLPPAQHGEGGGNAKGPQEVVIRAVVWGPGEHGTEAPGRGFKTAFLFSCGPLVLQLGAYKGG